MLHAESRSKETCNATGLVAPNHALEDDILSQEPAKVGGQRDELVDLAVVAVHKRHKKNPAQKPPRGASAIVSGNGQRKVKRR